eukprot:jgi/Galph1/1782/GphlegSOOS_G441.1
MSWKLHIWKSLGTLGNVVRGWDNVLKHRGDSESNQKSSRKFRQSDRISLRPSLSSPDGPAYKNVMQSNGVPSKRARVDSKAFRDPQSPTG